MNSKIIVFAVVLLFFCLSFNPLSALLSDSEVNWIEAAADERELAKIGTTTAGEWFYVLSDFPRTFTWRNLSPKSGLKTFVTITSSGIKEDIAKIYVGEISLWKEGAYFVVEGGSVYSDFSPTTIDGRYMANNYPSGNAFNKENIYVFPSKEHPIFNIKFERQDGAINDFVIIHEINFVNSAAREQFKKDLEYLKTDGKVPLPGTSELTLKPPTFNKAEPKKIEFSFTAPERLLDGYRVYISKGQKTEASVEDELKIADSSVDKADMLPVGSVEQVSQGQTVSKSMDKEMVVQLLGDWENGEYLVFVDKAKLGQPVEPVAGAFLEIKGVTPATPCDKCETILKCLACIDKKLVEGIFK